MARQANQSSPGRVFNIQSVSEYFRCRHILLWSWCIWTESSLHANSCSFAWFYGQTLASVLSDLLVSVHSIRFSVLWKRNFQALQLSFSIFQVHVELGRYIPYCFFSDFRSDVRQSKAISTMGQLHKNIYANLSFQEAIICQEMENTVLGILTFIVTTKLLRTIRFNSYVALFSRTLKISARSLSSFSIVLSIFFVAFLHFGVLIFASVSERYSSVLKAAYFQLEVTLGRVKARPINELAEANTI